jgi:hypothetical protein
VDNDELHVGRLGSQQGVGLAQLVGEDWADIVAADIGEGDHHDLSGLVLKTPQDAGLIPEGQAWSLGVAD